MVGSSKNRKSSPQLRERHVSFAVPSTEESTTQMSGPSAASFLQPTVGVPTAAPYAYGGDGALWSQNSPYYGLIDAPMPSSTAALYASQPTPMTDTFVRQTATVPGSHWVRPPPLGYRWSQAYRPFPLPAVFPEVPVDGDADGKWALPTLRNIGVASITAALLAVVIVVALVAESSVPIIDTGTSEMSRVVERIHSGDIGIPGPWQPINAPVAARKSVAMPPRPTTASPQRVVDHRRALPHAIRTAASTVAPRATVGMASTQRRSRNQTLPHQCSSHFYTYCTAAVSEFYYSASSRACLSTEVDSVHLCNHGANRFSNLGSCLASCVHSGQGEPHDRCYENALFGTCTRRDVAETWWYYNGSACTVWDFSLGNCPSLGRSVYRSRLECDRNCLSRQKGGNTTAYRPRRCGSPVAATCTPQQLKYPYFADMRVQGSVRCVKASSHTLRHKRCLIGSNRFDSITSCEQSCVHL